MNNMDISALPNNNHPGKFLQLDVGMLPVTHGMFQINAVLTGQQWQNRVYSEVKRNLSVQRSSPEGSPVLMDSVLRKHVTAITMTPKIKTNPLYSDMIIGIEDNPKSKPSWTIQEYDRQTIHGNLGDYSKEDPGELNFWLEELYTPGYDSLLRKKQAELTRKKICKVLTSVFVSVCVIIVVITVPIVVSRNKD
ncbi:major intrinsically disordered NOTCH2-binding receptor 1-like [Alosa sapidissima]|uniref:major intrinsically disordered NOTCH2-binding receptor 1-like n=1 Tax=Alosa sapidissima TaxID=34773 RepID=UPI001C090910|nr:major intrinsically disordered NOTCH2-binding receptor 1-like [Alosa sapidissima]